MFPPSVNQGGGKLPSFLPLLSLSVSRGHLAASALRPPICVHCVVVLLGLSENPPTHPRATAGPYVPVCGYSFTGAIRKHRCSLT